MSLSSFNGLTKFITMLTIIGLAPLEEIIVVGAIPSSLTLGGICTKIGGLIRVPNVEILVSLLLEEAD
jgi:hypothetical protein